MWYCTRSKNSPFEAIKAEMDDNIEGDEYIDYSGETSERLC